MSEAAASTLSPATRRWTYALVLVSTMTAIAANVFRADPLQSANDRSRWCTVESLLSGHGFVIDEIDADPAWSTIDKVRHEGHFYSTKPPLLPTLVAGVTWTIERLSGLDIRDDTRDVAAWTLIAVNLLPMTLALVLLADFVERYASTDFTRFFVVVTAAMGTLLVPFAATFNNHTVAAWSVTFALVVAARILLDDDRRPWCFAVCGFFAAFTCTNELPAASFGVAIFVLLHLRDARRTWAFFVPAALVPLVAYFVLNYLATGGLKPFYASYGSEKYLYVYEGVPSYWVHPTGIDTNRDSPLSYLFHCTFGHHGLWSLSPVFLVSVVTWFALPRWRNDRLATLAALGGGLTLLVLGFYMTRTENYNFGGISAGLRWTIWLTPFWLIALIPALDRIRAKWFRATAVVLLGVSTFSAWYSARTPWEQPWLFDVMERAGWIDYTDPPPELDAPLHTWFASVPQPGPDGAARWIEFRTVHSTGFDETLRLTAEEWMADGRVRLGIDTGAEPLVASINPTRLRKDVPLSAAVEWAPDFPAGPLFLVLLRGLPADRHFRAIATRYVRTPLRADAFECTQAIASVDRTTDDGRVLRHYCQTWLTPDVPFGCVKFETSVVDLERGELLSKRLWIATAASDFPEASSLRAFAGK